MQITEWSFEDGTSVADQKYLREFVTHAQNLDTIFDDWFLAKGNRLGVGTALNDDGTLQRDTIAISFDDAKGCQVGTVFIPRNEFIAHYQDVPLFDSFVKGWDKKSYRLHLHEDSYDSWIKEIGLTRSYALMNYIGPRSAASSLILSFGTSLGGLIEAHHINPKEYEDEDYKLDLDEEGLDLSNYFLLIPAYCTEPTRDVAPRMIFDPIYCRKTP